MSADPTSGTERDFERNRTGIFERNRIFERNGTAQFRPCLASRGLWMMVYRLLVHDCYNGLAIEATSGIKNSVEYQFGSISIWRLGSDNNTKGCFSLFASNIRLG